MTYIILIIVSLVLFGGFLALAGFEQKRGLRVAGAYRNRLDAKVSRATFIVTHVDWGAFVRHLAGTAFERMLHDVAHFILKLVRTTERLLTRAVKGLRERRGISTSIDSDEEKENPFSAGVQKVRTALRNARAASRKPAHRKAPETE